MGEREIFRRRELSIYGDANTIKRKSIVPPYRVVNFALSQSVFLRVNYESSVDRWPEFSGYKTLVRIVDKTGGNWKTYG